VLIARYRQLERAWRHLAAMKLKARSESAAPARIEEPA
jgi:hypothetical protein